MARIPVNLSLPPHLHDYWKSKNFDLSKLLQRTLEEMAGKPDKTLEEQERQQQEKIVKLQTELAVAQAIMKDIQEEMRTAQDKEKAELEEQQKKERQCKKCGKDADKPTLEKFNGYCGWECFPSRKTAVRTVEGEG